MRYYPLSKVRTGLKTDGSEFTLDGVPYSGEYYITFDGKVFSGPNPVVGKNKQLLPIENKTQIPNKSLTIKSKQELELRNKLSFHLPNYGNFIPYIPKPTQIDYNKGFIMRYFSKRINDNSSIIEISKEQHDDFLGSNTNGYDTIIHKVTSMFWQISGPRNTIKAPNYKTKPGVIDTNKRLTEEREKEFPGIIAYIGGEYEKFSVPNV